MKANIFAALLFTCSAFAAEPWQDVDATLGHQGKVVAGTFIDTVGRAPLLTKVNVKG